MGLDEFIIKKTSRKFENVNIKHLKVRTLHGIETITYEQQLIQNIGTVCTKFSCYRDAYGCYSEKRIHFILVVKIKYGKVVFLGEVLKIITLIEY